MTFQEQKLFQFPHFGNIEKFMNETEPTLVLVQRQFLILFQKWHLARFIVTALRICVTEIKGYMSTAFLPSICIGKFYAHQLPLQTPVVLYTQMNNFIQHLLMIQNL